MKRLLVILFATVATAHGQMLKDGDFSTGRGAWLGGGKLVKVDAQGTPVVSGTEGAPVLEVALARTQFTEIHQHFLCLHGEDGMKVTVILKASNDFARNDDSPKYSKDWTSGQWVWSAIVYPRADLCMRLDAHSHHYAPRMLKPGGDWQTVTGTFKGLGGPGPKEFSLIFATGTGTVQIKSITAEPL